jgi:hypothetical protein
MPSAAGKWLQVVKPAMRSKAIGARPTSKARRSLPGVEQNWQRAFAVTLRNSELEKHIGREKASRASYAKRMMWTMCIDGAALKSHYCLIETDVP